MSQKPDRVTAHVHKVRDKIIPLKQQHIFIFPRPCHKYDWPHTCHAKQWPDLDPSIDSTDKEVYSPPALSTDYFMDKDTGDLPANPETIEDCYLDIHTDDITSHEALNLDEIDGLDADFVSMGIHDQMTLDDAGDAPDDEDNYRDYGTIDWDQYKFGQDDHLSASNQVWAHWYSEYCDIEHQLSERDLAIC
ncbi:hypothetical protein K435DRAFT_866250 [Dendrothele bispora CBS 962.96]|uniref:Uncharacterized protein n=1 Tax=Dendrothele bispora (strain CBS 962.96) TaxID=1314807 RepID=A0A4S8LHG0_DENBC|nr:hypothetical protein K435DRAFT_866250 [Dendrothele bispora CBS 962.96]